MRQGQLLEAKTTRRDVLDEVGVAVTLVAVQRIGRRPSCLIPEFDGAIFSAKWKEALWARYVTAAPRSRTQSELRGETGTLRVPDPNYFGGDLSLARGPAGWETIPTATMPFGAPHGWPDYSDIADYRGLGLQDMASAIEAGREHECTGAVGFHTLAVLDAILNSAQTGKSHLPETLDDGAA